MARFKVGKQARTKRKNIVAVKSRFRKRGRRASIATLRALGLVDASTFPAGGYRPTIVDSRKALDNYQRTMKSTRLNPPQSTSEAPTPSA